MGQDSPLEGENDLSTAKEQHQRSILITSAVFFLITKQLHCNDAMQWCRFHAPGSLHHQQNTKVELNNKDESSNDLKIKCKCYRDVRGAIKVTDSTYNSHCSFPFLSLSIVLSFSHATPSSSHLSPALSVLLFP